MRLQPITIYTILYLFYVYLKVQGDDGTLSILRLFKGAGR